MYKERIIQLTDYSRFGERFYSSGLYLGGGPCSSDGGTAAGCAVSPLGCGASATGSATPPLSRLSPPSSTSRVNEALPHAQGQLDGGAWRVAGA